MLGSKAGLKTMEITHNQKIIVNGTVIYPDFTILLVSKRKVVYWEHRGMMDDADYARSAIARTKDYSKSGFYLGDSLFITEETSSTPLGTDEIQAIIAMLI